MCTCYQDEKFDQSKGPSITELVDKENVDMLQYMGWEIDQSKDLVKVTSFAVCICIAITDVTIHNLCVSI